MALCNIYALSDYVISRFDPSDDVGTDSAVSLDTKKIEFDTQATCWQAERHTYSY
jgi:hypothetical protein